MSDIKQIPLSDFGNALLQRQSSFQASAESSHDAKFKKNEPADPTQNMSDEQKAEWAKQKELHGDKFKKDKAAADESDTDAMYEDGEKLTGKALADWKKKHPDLAQNAENPPPEVKALKEKMKGKKGNFTWDQGLEDLATTQMDRTSAVDRVFKKVADLVKRELVAHPDKYQPTGMDWTFGASISDVDLTQTTFPIIATFTGMYGVGRRQQTMFQTEANWDQGLLESRRGSLRVKASGDARTWAKGILTILAKPVKGREASGDAAEADRAQARADEAKAEAKREEAEAEELKKSAGPTRQRLTWDPAVRAKLAARSPSGLYGYTKKVQADCEACSRKLARKAASIARTAWRKDERVASFLQTHAKRSKSGAAKLLVAAMKDIGPKIASQMDKAARVDESHCEECGNPIERRGREGWYHTDNPDLDADHQATPPRGVRAASDKEAAYGMYGASAKVARLGLTACASLKEAAGELAADLHRRRASAHGSYTGFLGEHSKTAKDGYSRMLLGFYPDNDSKVASIAPPESVDDWLSWDG